MKQQEAEVLANAGTIEHAVIMRRDGAWSVYLYGENFHSITREMDAVEVARGHGVIRSWSSLDSAHKWIRALPKADAIKVSIDG